MPVSGQYIKYTEILRSVYRDFGFNYELQHVDALEWIGSLMRLLGVHNVLKEKVTDNNSSLDHPDYITITDFSGGLPCDLHSITQCAAYLGDDATKACRGKLYPLNYSTDTMHKYTKTVCCSCQESSSTSDSVSTQRTDPSTLITESPENYVTIGTLTYKVNDSKIFTNFENGFIVMSYKAIPLDDEGFPLVPYEESFRKACIYEVAYRIAVKLWIRGDMTGDKFSWFERERNWYVAQAVNNSQMPSLDEWESFKNDRLRLIPKPDQHNGFFANLQLPERTWRHPYRLGYNS